MRTAMATRAASTEPGPRKLLEDDSQFRIGLEQAEHGRQRALAVAAIVVEELDHGDIAVGIAEGHLMR
jgi:hypothetical protein